jgi:hypothetical protein
MGSSTSPEARVAREVGGGYVVPRYRAEEDAVWYHVLHGNVPGYQIDFMYCPEVPHRRFTQNHFGHLARLMKYLEPRERAPYAFALGNLSRDDVQHEPGHGGLALIFGLRVQGVLDHAGRAMPPYAHAIVAVDRELDEGVLVEAALGLHRRLCAEGDGNGNGWEGEGESEYRSDRLYRRYVRAVRQQPGMVEKLLRRHVEGFSGLPRVAPSRLGWSFVAEESALPRRITITHTEDEPFEKLARTMARLGAMLYRSNVKWTTITSGRELDVPGGVSVRLVPENEAIAAEAGGIVIGIDAIPDDEVTMARVLFGASPKATISVPARVAWREKDAAHKAADAAGSAAGSGRVGVGRRVCATLPFVPGLGGEGDDLGRSGEDEVDEYARSQRGARRRLWVGLGAAGAGVCAIAAMVGSSPESAPEAVGSAAPGVGTIVPQVISVATGAATSGAAARASSERVELSPVASGRPRSTIRRGGDGAGPPRAPGAIGGKPRF